MVRLNTPKRKILTRKDFEEYPVWTWDEEMENVLPLSEDNPDLDDYGDLFIKARFKTSSYRFDGYLMGGDHFYGFVIFLKDEKFMFNINTASLNSVHLINLFRFIDCKPFNFFPVEYESDVILKGNRKISGTLTFEA